MPGGVNSPVRAFKSVGGQPIIIDSVKGCRMWDIDCNEYIDYVGSWGPAIIGHADDQVLFHIPFPSIILLLLSVCLFILFNFNCYNRCLLLCLKQ
jgi:hypothetical protein